MNSHTEIQRLVDSVVVPPEMTFRGTYNAPEMTWEFQIRLTVTNVRGRSKIPLDLDRTVSEQSLENCPVQFLGDLVNSMAMEIFHHDFHEWFRVDGKWDESVDIHGRGKNPTTPTERKDDD